MLGSQTARFSFFSRQLDPDLLHPNLDPQLCISACFLIDSGLSPEDLATPHTLLDLPTTSPTPCPTDLVSPEDLVTPPTPLSLSTMRPTQCLADPASHRDQATLLTLTDPLPTSTTVPTDTVADLATVAMVDPALDTEHPTTESGELLLKQCELVIDEKVYKLTLFQS